jgi:hypothetical protein
LQRNIKTEKIGRSRRGSMPSEIASVKMSGDSRKKGDEERSHLDSLATGLQGEVDAGPR